MEKVWAAKDAAATKPVIAKGTSCGWPSHYRSGLWSVPRVGPGSRRNGAPAVHVPWPARNRLLSDSSDPLFELRATTLSLSLRPNCLCPVTVLDCSAPSPLARAPWPRPHPPPQHCSRGPRAVRPTSSPPPPPPRRLTRGASLASGTHARTSPPCSDRSHEYMPPPDARPVAAEICAIE
jgi:hypothetical protein